MATSGRWPYSSCQASGLETRPARLSHARKPAGKCAPAHAGLERSGGMLMSPHATFKPTEIEPVAWTPRPCFFAGFRTEEASVLPTNLKRNQFGLIRHRRFITAADVPSKPFRDCVEESANGGRVALSDEFHAAIRLVANEPRHWKPRGDVARREPESDALHTAGVDHADGLSNR